jgi:hypothetical protein
MGREDSKSPIAHPPDAKTLTDFESRVANDGPLADNFRLDLVTGTSRSVWNKRAAQVFRTAFLKCDWTTWKDRKGIEAAFITHIATIRNQYKKQLGLNTSSRLAQDKNKAANRNSRRKTVSSYVGVVILSSLLLTSTFLPVFLASRTAGHGLFSAS